MLHANQTGVTILSSTECHKLWLIPPWEQGVVGIKLKNVCIANSSLTHEQQTFSDTPRKISTPALINQR